MFYHPTYIEILLRPSSPLTILQVMVSCSSSSYKHVQVHLTCVNFMLVHACLLFIFLCFLNMKTASVGQAINFLSTEFVVVGNFSFTERLTVKYAGAVAMYFVSKNLKKKYNITDERAALYEAAETWVNALNGREFLGTLFPILHGFMIEEMTSLK